MTDANGLYYMRARFYNPELKRFVNQDVLTGSISDSTSLNRFSYVNGDPVGKIDPSGMVSDSGAGGGGGKTKNSLQYGYIEKTKQWFLISPYDNIPYKAKWVKQKGKYKLVPVNMAEFCQNYGVNLSTVKIPKNLSGREKQFAEMFSTCTYVASTSLSLSGSGNMVIGGSPALKMKSASMVSQKDYQSYLNRMSASGKVVNGNMASGTGKSGLNDVALKLTGNKKLYYNATGKIPTGEVHHTLPQQFADEFSEVGLDVNSGKFLFDIPKNLHRLKPDGLHTTTNPLGQTWNAAWKDFFMKNPDFSKADVLNQWEYMIQKTGIVKFK